MNGRVALLLLDYFRRTLLVWPLLAIVHVMQATSFWVAHVDRLPLLAAFIASIAYFAAFESPYAVLRTLPLTRAEAALFRWWASIGGPGFVIFLCTSLAWLASADNGWPHPSQTEVTRHALASWAVLSVLASLPLPTRQPGRMTLGRFTLVWGALFVAAFYGLPLAVLPEPALTIFIALGIALSIVSYIRAWRGRLTAFPAAAIPWRSRPEPRQSRSVGRFHGWSLLAVDVARTTMLLSFVALIAVSLVRWLYPILDAGVPLVWVFVSAVAVAACLLSRQWIQSVRPLRILPIGAHRLTLVLYGLLILPGIFACAVATVAWQLSPHLGVHVPLYLLIAFVVSPVTLVPWQQSRYTPGPVASSAQQWAPLMQQFAWPLWTGALSSYGSPHLMPTAFLVVVLFTALAWSIIGYFALLGGIRSTFAFEKFGGPLGAES